MMDIIILCDDDDDDKKLPVRFMIIVNFNETVSYKKKQCIVNFKKSVLPDHMNVYKYYLQCTINLYQQHCAARYGSALILTIRTENRRPDERYQHHLADCAGAACSGRVVACPLRHVNDVKQLPNRGHSFCSGKAYLLLSDCLRQLQRHCLRLLVLRRFPRFVRRYEVVPGTACCRPACPGRALHGSDPEY
jgi:hypothetical protein